MPQGIALLAEQLEELLEQYTQGKMGPSRKLGEDD